MPMTSLHKSKKVLERKLVTQQYTQSYKCFKVFIKFLFVSSSNQYNTNNFSQNEHKNLINLIAQNSFFKFSQTHKPL